MKNRNPIPKEIKDQVVNRNGGRFCEKCGRKKGLHFHHIIARQDGGTNDLDNLSLLCEGCHREWHSVESVSTLGFKDWIGYPPVHQLIASIASIDRIPPGASAVEFVDAIMQSHQCQKNIRQNLTFEDDEQ